MTEIPQRQIRAGDEPHVGDWIIGVSDVTSLADAIEAKASARDWPGAEALLPGERPYTIR